MKKICSRCNIAQDIDEFFNSSITKDGKRQYCKACCRIEQVERQNKIKNDPILLEQQRERNRARTRSLEYKENHKKWRQSDKGQVAIFKNSIMSKYGITIDEYEKILSEQDNACAACKILLVSTMHKHIDHCHKTNRVRGILCSACNKALGFAKDRIENLEGLIFYLRKDLINYGQVKRRVFIESPYAGNVDQNVLYARRACKDSLIRGEVPFASHLLYTQVLDDNIPEERSLGIEAGLIWGKICDVSIAYIDYGISSGMQYGIDRAKQEGRPVEVRKIGKNL